MSSITSSSYPVTTDSQDGDLFAIVRNGQLLKMNRAALQAFIETLAPNTFLSLTDAPGTFVGKAGQVPAVNLAEDALEFVAGAANFFVSLTDSAGPYAGEAGKNVRVNATEDGLEYHSPTFIGLGDVPAAFAGSGTYLVRVNVAANALEFVPFSTVVPSNATCGSFDYDHNGANQAYTGGSGFVKILNDAAGANTRTDIGPSGITSVYDEINSQLDFSELSVGDIATIRVSMDVTTTAANQIVNAQLYFDNNGTPFSLVMDHSEYKTAGVQPYSREITFYIGSTDVKDYPVEVQFASDANATINMGGWAVFIQHRGA